MSEAAEILQEEPSTTPSLGDRQAALVDEILALRASGRDRAAKSRTAELLLTLKPILIRVVRKFAHRAGSHSEGDLEQIATISALKAIEKFDVSRAKSQSFGYFVYFRAMADVDARVRMQGADVSVSDHAANGRTKKKVEIGVVVTSRDAVTPRAASDGERAGSEYREEALPHEQHDETPEQLLGNEQEKARLFEKVRTLPPQERELVQRHFGINRPQQSVRNIADEWKAPKSRIDRMLVKALEKLRADLTDE